MIYQTFWNGPLAGQGFKAHPNEIARVLSYYRVMCDHDLDIVTRNLCAGAVCIGRALYVRSGNRWICKTLEPAPGLPRRVK